MCNLKAYIQTVNENTDKLDCQMCEYMTIIEDTEILEFRDSKLNEVTRADQLLNLILFRSPNINLSILKLSNCQLGDLFKKLLEKIDECGHQLRVLDVSSCELNEESMIQLKVFMNNF